MYLRYYLNEKGERVYTFKVRILQFNILYQYVTDDGIKTFSAHPARFSPDDKFSQERLTLKKRFKLLLTDKPDANL